MWEVWVERNDQMEQTCNFSHAIFRCVESSKSLSKHAPLREDASRWHITNPSAASEVKVQHRMVGLGRLIRVFTVEHAMHHDILTHAQTDLPMQEIHA